MLKRLKYVSQFARALSPAQIDALTRRSAENNKKVEVTGVLMTTGGLFFQVIEGPAEQIDALWAKIQHDPRHKDVLLLGVEEGVSRRLFPQWSMRKVDLKEGTEYRLEPLRTLLATIIQDRERIAQLTDVLARGVWHELVDAGQLKRV